MLSLKAPEWHFMKLAWTVTCITGIHRVPYPEPDPRCSGWSTMLHFPKIRLSCYWWFHTFPQSNFYLFLLLVLPPPHFQTLLSVVASFMILGKSLWEIWDAFSFKDYYYRRNLCWRQSCWFQGPPGSKLRPEPGSMVFCETTLSTGPFVSNLACERNISAAFWMLTRPAEPLPTGDRCFLYPPGWPAFMSGKLNSSKLFPGSCSLFLKFIANSCWLGVGWGASGKFFIMNWPWYWPIQWKKRERFCYIIM